MPTVLASVPAEMEAPVTEMGGGGRWTERVRVANEEGEIPQGEDGGLCQSGAGWSYQVLRADVLLV